MAPIHYVSADGLEKLKQELQDLKTNGRREAAGRIETAKALGDLSENAEYHEAKDALSFIERRIMEIEEILKNVSVIEQETGAKGVIRVGSTVTVRAKGQEKIYKIVGSNEAEPASGKISNESPIGSALIGARVGQTVEVRTPSGKMPYDVVEVS